MSARYHINSQGDPGLCRARKGRCPFGEDEAHYGSPKEARKAFEEAMTSQPVTLKPALKTLDVEGLQQALLAEASERGLTVPLVAKAMELATELHEGQYRAAAPGEARPPYITHPLRNAIRVLRWGAKEDNTVLGALLHDVVEDCALKFAKDRAILVKSEAEAREVLLDYIAHNFNSRVREIVLKLSNPLVSHEERAKLSLEDKINRYTTHVDKSITDDPEVFLLKLSDLHDNGAGLYHTDYADRKAQTERQAKKYLQTIHLLRRESAKGYFKSPEIQKSVEASIDLIEARLSWMLARQTPTKG